jgi:hypothetical protein
MFGTTPAHGFIVRHAERIEISDFKIRMSGNDARPGILLLDVNDADFSNIKMPKTGDVPQVVLNDVRDFNIVRSKPVPDTRIPETKHHEL